MELYPDMYATLNLKEGPAGKCEKGKGRERCVKRGKNSSEMNHKPLQVDSSAKYDPDDMARTTGKEKEENYDDSSAPASELAEKSKKRSRDEVSPVEETGECSTKPRRSGSTSRGSSEEGRSNKRPRQSVDDHDSATKQ